MPGGRECSWWAGSSALYDHSGTHVLSIVLLCRPLGVVSWWKLGLWGSCRWEGKGTRKAHAHVREGLGNCLGWRSAELGRTHSTPGCASCPSKRSAASPRGARRPHRLPALLPVFALLPFPQHPPNERVLFRSFSCEEKSEMGDGEEPVGCGIARDCGWGGVNGWRGEIRGSPATRALLYFYRTRSFTFLLTVCWRTNTRVSGGPALEEEIGGHYCCQVV